MEQMPNGGILEFLKGKCVLVTGSTGFLAKILVEKLLRVQPEVKKLYLLLRAPDAKSALQRMNAEIIGKELFKILKDKHGKEFQTFISNKLAPIAGDVTIENLGINDAKLRESMWSEIDVVVHVAATTNFYERYDVAFNINVKGAKHVLAFAQRCSHLKSLLHISTAYVSVSKHGIIPERKLQIGECFNGISTLDIDAEAKLIEETLKELRASGSTKEEEKIAMKQLGLNRSRIFGWPNVYVFSKSMGEMLLGQMRGNLPLVILRPTIITSTISDPFPGWMEGIRTIDSLIIAYGKGKLSCFLGDLGLTMDVIPGDMVVNAMIAAIVAHSNQPSEFIYHISSSVSNPVKYFSLLQCSRRYFARNPQVGKNGKTIKVHDIPVLSDIRSFETYMSLRYKIPLQGLRLVNLAFCGLFSDHFNELNRKYNFVMHMAHLYEPFALFKGCFDDLNLERLRIQVKSIASEREMFRFDPQSIDWNNYLTEVHIPGLLKYVTK